MSAECSSSPSAGAGRCAPGSLELIAAARALTQEGAGGR